MGRDGNNAKDAIQKVLNPGRGGGGGEEQKCDLELLTSHVLVGTPNQCVSHWLCPLCFVSQVNMVFDHLKETRNFTGYTLFLEEDHYLSPDFVVMAKKLRKLKEE